VGCGVFFGRRFFPAHGPPARNGGPSLRWALLREEWPFFGILPRLRGGGFQLLCRLEQQLRFAVHGPGNPVASPRSHGMPRRDIPGRVYISVDRQAAGAAPEPRLALSRFRVAVPAARVGLRRIRGVVPQHRLLGRRGEQAIPGHANTLAKTTDIPGEVKRRFPPRPEARGPHAAILMTVRRTPPGCGAPGDLGGA